ncbi:MAG: threonine/serine dehydratase [Myxococcales bacterium]
MVDRDAIERTWATLKEHVRETPVVRVDPPSVGLSGGYELWLKLEFLQYSGSFKARGAFANLLLRKPPPAGVVAASGGNHGAAVAFAAQRFGIPARIFVPTISSPAKVARIRAAGAQVEQVGERYADALEASERYADESGALRIHAFDQDETMMGAGSLGLELERQVPGAATVLAAVGGGGLLAGIAAWYEGRARIVGVVPEKAPTLTRALEAGRPVDAEAGGIAADSLAPRRVGERVFPILRAHAIALLVTDEAIAQAQRALWDGLRVVVEPGGAAAFAALLSGRYLPRAGERVAVVLSGANTTAVSI